MKKTTAKIREDLARLQEQLKQAETRDAERIGRIALKAGLGEIEIEDADLQTAFEDLAKRFRGGKPATAAKERGAGSSASTPETPPLGNGASSSQSGEA